MATITNNVRWADNTVDLKRNLLQGIDTIDAMKRSVDRTAESLGGSGLFRAANTTTAAIQQMGGATKLTAAELDQANTKIDKAIEKYDALGRTAPTAMRELSVELKKASAAAESMADKAERVGASMSKIGGSLQSVGTTLSVGITAPLVALGYSALKASIDFETAFAGVRKTVTGTPEEMQALNTEFREMAKVTPVSAVGLAHIGEMAGQLGVSKDHIIGFTKTIVDISTATNLTADEAGASFAKLANVMKLPQDQFSNLGSAVVALGNFGASTEKEMLDMAQRISAAGAAAGFTVPQVLGISNALASVGIEAEAGGTAISRVITKMATDVAKGSGHLKDFARIAGMSSQQFQTAWKADAGQAFSAFMEGLSHVKDKGESLFLTMDELGFKEVRLKNAMLSAAGAGDLMKDSIALGSKAFTENTELTRAAGERYVTTANQLKILENKFTDVQITLGDALKPVLIDLMQAALPLLEWAASAAKYFAELPEPVRLLILGLTALAALIGPFVFVLGSFVGAVGQLATAFALFQGAEAIGGFAALTGFLANPLVLGAALVIGGIALAIYEVNKSLTDMEHHSTAGQVLQGLKDGNGNPMISVDAAKSMGLKRSGNPEAATEELKDGTTLTIAGFKPKGAPAGGGGATTVPLGKAAARQAAADLEVLTNATRSYAAVLDLVSNATYEGIKADLARGVEAGVVAREYKVGITVVKDVVAIEKEYAVAQKDVLKAKEEVRLGSIALTEAQQAEALELMKLPVSLHTIAVEVGAADIQIKVFQESLKELGKIRAIESGRGPLLGPIVGQELVNVKQQLHDITAELTKIHQIEQGVPLSGPIKGELLYKPSKSDLPKGLTSEMDRLSHAVDQVARAFDGMAHSADAATRNTGLAIASAPQFMSIFQAYQKNAAMGADYKGPGGMSAGATAGWQMGGAAAGVVAQMIDTGPGASTGALIGHGALQGAAIGTMIMPGWGTAIGAGVGAIAGWVQSGKEWRKVVNDIGRDFAGLKVSEEFADMIDKLEDETGLSRAQAITTQLDKLIETAGGLTTKNFDLFFGKLHDAFSYLEQGGLSVAHVTQILDKNFLAFAAVGVDAYGRINDQVRELIDLDQRFKTESHAVAEFLRQQGENAMHGFTLIVEGTADAVLGYEALKKAVDDATASGKQDDITAALTAQHAGGVKAGPELGDLGIQAVASYTAAVASGTSPADALKAMGPALTALDASYKALGLDITDVALKNLLMLNNLNAANPKLIASVAGLSKEMIALDNMGLMNATTFGSMERTGMAMYTRLQAAAFAVGGTTKDALGPMQDYLHQAVIEAKALGIPLDDATQQLIYQSKELGIWKEVGKGAMDLVTDAVVKLVDKVGELIDQLKGVPHVTPTVTPPGGPVADPNAGGGVDTGAPDPYNLQPMASGGFGYASGPMAFSTQGNEFYAFSGEGKSFTGGMSGVLKGDGNDGLSSDYSFGPGAGGGAYNYHHPVSPSGSDGAIDGSGGGVTYHININAVDANSFKALCERYPEAVASGVIKAVQYNKGSSDTRLRGALRMK